MNGEAITTEKMLSRRSARIKVLQTLYAMNRDDSTTSDQGISNYWKSIDQSGELLLFTWYSILQIIATAEEDFNQRKNKYLPSEEDKAFTPILYKNDGLSIIVKQKDLNAKYKKLNFAEKVDNDILAKIYFEFAKSEPYKDFIKGTKTQEDIEDIYLELFRHCRSNENFLEFIEDRYINWEDDKSLIVGNIKKILKVVKDSEGIDFSKFDPDPDTTQVFGETLLKYTLTNDKTLLSHIEPVLENWDSERVAVIDLILLKMAVSELIAFSSVPTKVTINEYVELAKNYSTPKSKEFINGILDKLVRELQEKGVLKKEGRGLIDS